MDGPPSPASSAGSAREDRQGREAETTQNTPEEAARRRLEQAILAACNSLWDLGVAANDVQGEDVVGSMVNDTIAHLANLDQLKHTVNGIQVPAKVIDYVDQGKNPDLHTQEQVENVAGENMYVKAKVEGIGNYHKLLSSALSTSFPELGPHLSPTKIGSSENQTLSPSSPPREPSRPDAEAANGTSSSAHEPAMVTSTFTTDG